jgi:D-xylose transport system substrate-binding protein
MVKTRRTRIASLFAVGALVLAATAACGSSDDKKSSSGNGGGSKGKVGVILPDATTSPRWEGNDRPSLQKAFDDAGIDSDIQNAGGDTAKFGTICDSMINEGV